MIEEIHRKTKRKKRVWFCSAQIVCLFVLNFQNLDSDAATFITAEMASYKTSDMAPGMTTGMKTGMPLEMKFNMNRGWPVADLSRLTQEKM